MPCNSIKILIISLLFAICISFNKVGAQSHTFTTSNELFLKARDTMLYDVHAFCNYVEEGLQKFQVDDHSIGKRRGMAYKSLCYTYSGQFSKAAFIADSVLAIEDIDHLSRVYALGALGGNEQFQNRSQTAVKYYLLALEEAEAGNLTLEKGMINNALAFQFYELEVYAKSVQYAEKALHLGEQIKHRGLMMAALKRLHYNYVGDEEPSHINKANAYKIRMDSIVALVHNPEESMLSYMDTGWMLLDNNLYDSAEVYYLKAFELSKKINDTLHIGLCLGNLGKIYIAKNELEKAKPLFGQLEGLIDPLKEESDILFMIYQLAQFEIAKGNYKKASHLFVEYIDRDQVFFEATVRQDMLNYEAEYEHLKQRSEIEKQQLQISQRTVQRNLALTGGGLILTLGLLSFVWFRNKTFKKEMAQSQQLMQTENKLIESRMQMMRAQMNPHFLFNSLNSIKHFILQKTKDESAQYISDFAKLMRLNLQNSTEILIPLEREIVFLKQYLLMEQMRFKKPFEVTWDIQEGINLDVYKFPPMLIQPYIENAIWHGLRYRKIGLEKESQGALGNTSLMKESRGALENGLIHIHIGIINEDNLVCIIQDNGVGRVKSEEIKSRSFSLRKSMGTKITEDRIAMTNQILDADIRIHTEDLYNNTGIALGTRVTIYIPYITENI